MTVPKVNRVLETALYVADLDRSQAFYERVFGFTVMLRDHRMCALAVHGRQALLLFKLGGSVQPSETPNGTIPPHAKVAIESRLEWATGGSSLYFRDPDAHSIEVGTPGLWSNDPRS